MADLTPFDEFMMGINLCITKIICNFIVVKVIYQSLFRIYKSNETMKIL